MSVSRSEPRSGNDCLQESVFCKIVGGLVSPILANIYLDRLDKFVEQTLIPEYTRGKKRAKNPDYDRTSNRAYYCRATGRVAEAKRLEKARRAIPANDPHDPDYRRLYYVRYADDFLLGFIGPRCEAEAIRDRLKTFLAQELKLELSEAKTLITHANTQKARFLGYDISVTRCDTKIGGNRRSVNGGIALRMPASFVAERSRFYMRDGKAIHRMERTHSSDYSIICEYQAEYRGYVRYYQLADNIAWLNTLHWIMRTSLLKTLAHKHKSSVTKMARRFAAKVATPYGPRTCLETRVPRVGKEPLIARFGGLPLRMRLTVDFEDPLLARKRQRAPSCFSGSWRMNARRVARRRTWRSTMSANSPTCTVRGGSRRPTGFDSWHRDGGRRWSSAASAMTISTPDDRCEARRNE